MNFEALLAEFDTLQKSMDEQADAADAKIKAAAEEGEGDDKDGEEGEGSTESKDADGKGEGEEAFGKSFSFKLDSGEEVEAVDGTELVKSLIGKVDEFAAGRDADKKHVADALTGALGLIKKQGEMIKSLTDQVAGLAKEGRGRKSTLSVADKQEGSEDLTKSQPEGMPSGEFLTKCIAAQKEGRISGMDVSRAQIAINSGVAVPASIVSRVTGQ